MDSIDDGESQCEQPLAYDKMRGVKARESAEWPKAKAVVMKTTCNWQPVKASAKPVAQA